MNVRVTGMPNSPEDENTDFSMECSECGPLGVCEDRTSVDSTALAHLEFHGIDITPFLQGGN